MASKMFNGKTGSEMGRSILNEVERSASGTSGTFQLNGFDQLQQSLGQFSQGLSSIAALPQNIANVVSTNTTHENSKNTSAEMDYSASISQIVTAINSVYSAVREVTSSVNNGAISLVSKLDTLNINAHPNSGQTSSFPDWLGLTNALNDNTSALALSHEALIRLVNYQHNDSYQEARSSYSGLRDYSSEIALLISQLQALTTEAKSLQPLIDTNSQKSEALCLSVQSHSSDYKALSSAMNDLTTSVNALQNIIKDFTPGNNIEVNLTQQGSSIQSKSDADYAAQSAYRLIKTGFGNGGV